VPVEEKDCRKSLILGGRGNILTNRQMGEKSFNFRDIHIFGVAFVMEKDEAFNPVEIGFFGADRVMHSSQRVADLVE